MTETDRLRQRLLDDIERFVRKHDIAETTFGKRAMNDGKFVARLRGGENMTTGSFERAWEYMKEAEAAA